MPTVDTYRFVRDFTCKGAECADTCCYGWGMQVDTDTLERYKTQAPELLTAVTSGEAQHIMKRDPNTDYCVKFDKGLCGIHKQYGSDFLGDACHFFPRITRHFGKATQMGASLSCPEIVRLITESDDPFSLAPVEVERLPHSIKDYLPAGMSSEDGLAILRQCIDASQDPQATSDQIMRRFITVTKSLQNVSTERWKDGISFLFTTADSRIMPAVKEVEDPYRLLHALAGLIHAANAHKRTRLMDVFHGIEKALHATIDWTTLDIGTYDLTFNTAESLYNPTALSAVEPMLKKWIGAQCIMNSLPFGGYTIPLSERIAIISIRFATVKLALLSHVTRDGTIDNATAIRVIQALSRFLDHLADPTLSLAIYRDAGWLSEARLNGLV